MGCISSKFISRSMSFQEELGQSIQRPPNLCGRGDFATPKTKNDHFLALIGDTDKVNNKLRSESFSKSYIKPTTDNTLNSDTWELQSCLEHDAQKKQGEAHVLMVMQRSRSYHWSLENEELPPDSGSLDGPEEESRSYKGMKKRAWSFHTVEEYDALLERIGLSTTHQSNSQDGDSVIEMQPNASQSSLHPVDHKADAIEYDGDVIHIQEMQPSNPVEDSITVEKASPEENSVIVETSTLVDPELECRTSAANPIKSRASGETNDNNHSSEGDTLEKGLKRKSVAESLKSLEIPESIQFQAVASLREWLHAGGQVYSPGSYITPKFGSHYLPKSGTENKDDDRYIFNPELVAAFEGSMQQLDKEVETILGQITENLEEETVVEKQV